MPEFLPKQNGENIIFISGGSGAGKQMLIAHLVQLLDELLWFSVSYTTRQPRPGEVDGVDYHFVSEEAFLRLIDANAFIEHAKVHGYRYGTPRQPIFDALANNKIVVGDADVQGVAIMREEFPKAAFFFLYVEEAELRKRLEARGDVSPDDLIVRLDNSREETKMARSVYLPEHLIPSVTVLDESGNVTDQGIRDAAAMLLVQLKAQALHSWGYSRAFHRLVIRI